MYTFTNKLRNLSIILMVAGFLGLTYGFLSAPNTIEDAQAMVDDTHHGDGHGASHGEATPDSDHTESHADEKIIIIIRLQLTVNKMVKIIVKNMVVITTENIYYTNYKISHGLPFTLRLSFL